MALSSQTLIELTQLFVKWESTTAYTTPPPIARADDEKQDKLRVTLSVVLFDVNISANAIK